MSQISNYILLAGLALTVAACGTGAVDEASAHAAPSEAGTTVLVLDTTVPVSLDASGTAEAFAQATLSTKLMGTVLEVLVREGDQVKKGTPLVRIDARDLAAKQGQARAVLSAAAAVHREASLHAARIRALYADSAATRAQLDAAETAFARAAAAVAQADDGVTEVATLTDYAVVRAPFDGMVTARFLDAGAFAVPGAPLVTVQDTRRLRLTATVSPDAVRGLRRGTTIVVSIADEPATAVIEGVVPAAMGNAYIVNAIVDNRGERHLSGSAATLSLPRGESRALLIPAAALRQEGDLTGVLVRGTNGDDLRWVRLGRRFGDRVEVTGGLDAGEAVVMPSAAPAPTTAAPQEN